MNTKLIKGAAALLCTCSALAMSFKGGHSEQDADKKATTVAADSKELVITFPEKSSDYGVGTYKVEGVLAKGKKVKIMLDDKEVKALTTNSEDGQYDIEVKVAEAGKHVLLAEFEDAKGREVLRKLEFRSSHNQISDAAPAASESKNEEVAVKTPDEPVKKAVDKTPNPEDKTEEASSSSLLPDPVEISSSDPNSSSNRKAAGAHDDKLKPKEPATIKKPAKVANANITFAISSHTNFNVVSHGIIQVGGKGKPGDKVILLIDNKPSMKGTIKPDGRWKFPVKIAKAGCRKITAQDLTSRQARFVKLKIK